VERFGGRESQRKEIAVANQSVDFLEGRPELQKAMEAVQASDEEAKKFADDPKGYLQSKGISTESLNFPESGELSEDDLEKVAGGSVACGSFGGLSFCGGLGIDIEL
jgi:hypothetical protein